MINNLIKRLGAGKSGSALIMTMVLTVLLAIVAVMFVAVARMDRASTSNIADNKSLDLAAKSITEIISKDLVLDTPRATGYDPNKYADYPDSNHPWLASLEPYKSGTDYYWRQISDVTGYLKNKGFDTNDVDVNVPGNAKVVKEYPDIKLTNGNLNELWADADGDGIADSKWIELKDSACLRSSKGQKIYAAVRVIDNGGMVNINTAHKFDVNSNDVNKIDGSSQMQINLKGLLKGTDSIVKLHQARCGSDSNTWAIYQKNVIWDYNSVPNGNYIPFDISDELELRYRYCIDSKFISRFEVNDPCTPRGAGGKRNFGYLYNSDGGWGLADWQNRITNFNDPCADRRHLLTAYNLDRVIEPNGVKMVNINSADVNTLYNTIHSVISDVDTAAQIAVNIIDYRDSNSEVTVFPKNGKNYYGFERPCVYLSELAYKSDGIDTYFAVELYKPYGSSDINPPDNTWHVVINGTISIPITNWIGGMNPYVIVSQSGGLVAPPSSQIEPTLVFGEGDTISLTRTVDIGGTPTDIVVDSVLIQSSGTLITPDGLPHSLKRDVTPAKCIRRLWRPTATSPPLLPSLGLTGDYTFPEATPIYIQAHPKNASFTNIGEIGMIFRKPAYYKPGDPCANVIGYGTNTTEAQVRLDLTDLNYQQLFKYLTVMDPNRHGAAANETRVKGRININTAPASVLAQLPWVAHRKLGYNEPNLAKAIVAYRDKTKVTSQLSIDYSNRNIATGISNISEVKGFRSIGELMNVIKKDPNNLEKRCDIRYYALDGLDQIGFPDLDEPAGDGAADDFEERDLIFTRISDLVTVRSDIFTAYMLIRIGVDGPQKRYMVILDRSNVKSASDKIKIIAFQPVPQAR